MVVEAKVTDTVIFILLIVDARKDMEEVEAVLEIFITHTRCTNGMILFYQKQGYKQLSNGET